MAYREDILQQPQAVLNTLNRWGMTPSLEQVVHRLRSGEYRRVVLTGMGSSLYALIPLWYRLLDAGIQTLWVETGELLHYGAEWVKPEDLLVVVSQSGRSAEVVELIKRNPSPILGVTNTPESPLAQTAETLVLTDAGEEATVSCKTYVATLTSLALLGEAFLGNDLLQLQRGLEATAFQMEAYLSRVDDHVNHLAGILQGIEHVIYAGRGVSLASAETAGLITKESVKIPAEGMSAAAFRHGPFELISPRLFVLVFEGEEPTRALHRNLVNEVNRLQGRAQLAGESAQDEVFHLQPLNIHVRPLMEILPVQMMTLALAHLRGRIAGEFTLASKVTDVQ
ncbi:SIS domain-containing protein [Anaerolinea thermophila]|uniref:Glutamine--fructose-6-phosphate aminotransferase [isomerizing] n=1 Tax=Anaerolinea thermophila (strain DSM 14523 / JCM 11388 / NBRC 100420 / UNI-1) TaxID=926569 RepID=E8N3C1_ANATU|nr:SIS domain-containing protein [Anaerolinea thermophila]BAJ62935.1 putative sugar isomerase [Anaerolinea thermophila UNI-1]